MEIFSISKVSLTPMFIFVIFVGLALTIVPLIVFHSQARYALVVVGLLVIGYSVYMLLIHVNYEVKISAERLSIEGSPYSYSVNRDQVLIDEVSVLEWNKLKQKIQRRTKGIGLPNFKVGNFRITDNKKGFLLITGRMGIVSIPLKNGSIIFLSLDEPEKFIQSL